MAITSIVRDWGTHPAIVRITVQNESYATVSTAGYLTAQLANIESINAGPFEWENSDFVLVWLVNTVASPNTSSWSLFTISADFTSLTPFTPNGSVSLNAINQMASGSELLLAKGTATGLTPAISQQSGIITTTALTTVSGAAATVTLTNALITTTSVILVQVMGGSNTTAGITLVATPGTGTATILIQNSGVAAVALNGTVIIGFAVF